MKYRIIKDKWLGFEVQRKRAWFPLWIQCRLANTHSTLVRAKRAIRRYKRETYLYRFMVWNKNRKKCVVYKESL